MDFSQLTVMLAVRLSPVSFAWLVKVMVMLSPASPLSGLMLSQLADTELVHALVAEMVNVAVETVLSNASPVAGTPCPKVTLPLTTGVSGVSGVS